MKPNIVVAVDGSDDSTRALEWAIREAKVHGRPLVLVHCVPQLLRDTDEPVGPGDRAANDLVLGAARHRAEQVIGAAISVRRLEPRGLDAGPALVVAAGIEDLLVVGARGHSRVAGMLLGSVSHYVVRHAAGPVAVVRPRADGFASRTVVGFDDSPVAQHALEFALARAARAGGDVVVVRAWRGAALHGGLNVLPLPVDAAWQQEKQRLALEEEIVPWREKWPGVRMVGEAVPGHAAHILVDASRHAGLVVVGSSRHAAAAQAVLGSVEESVLHHASSPVVVVR